ncbi:hypothetical protein [Saccharothrix variisporea]|uniref:Uncharacterized protein n=1 Tax=Saccharothrix variisporea TaxID=543527 RepID=A0A495X9K2_9PSEU|nr:hypothetical protein [Saccharothrix variisporea]RKT70900.1 hypothetical protein DFJ66_4177 [Saccharothrix variisporea]
MSSGGIVLAPLAVPVVAAGAVVVAGAVAVGAVAVLAARAANAAIEGSVRALGNYGEKLEAEVAGLEAAAADARRWEVAAADVVAVNARIRLLRERAAGTTVDVPAPLRLGASRDPVELGRWVGEVQVELARAQEALDALVPLPELVIEKSTVDTRMADALASHREALRRRYATAVAAAPEPVSPGAVERVLALLDPDASTDERSAALSAAALVTAHPHEQDVYLAALRRRITAEINPAVARRRLAASWVEALEGDPLGEVLAGARPPAGLEGTADELRAVVAGTRDLTARLRADAVRLVEWAEETAQRAFVCELVKHHLTDLGYQVEDTFEVRHSAGLRLTRADWSGEHVADVWVDAHATVHGQVLREVAGAGDDARITDRERCDTFADDLEAVAGRVPQAQVVVDRTAALPVRTATDATTATGQQQKRRAR